MNNTTARKSPEDFKLSNQFALKLEKEMKDRLGYNSSKAKEWAKEIDSLYRKYI